MFTTLFTAALFIAPAIQGALADFSVNTPALVQCKEAKISWEETKGPYNVIVVPAATPCGDTYVDAGDHNSTSFSWQATVPAGMKVQVSVEDANGDEAWSGTITVASSDDVTCVNPELLALATSATNSATTGTTPTGTTVDSSPSPSASIEVVGAVGQGILGDSGDSNSAATTKSSIMLLGAVVALAAFML